MNNKTFIIDWDNYTEISKLGQQIKSRLSKLNPSRKIPKKQIDKDTLFCYK